MIRPADDAADGLSSVILILHSIAIILLGAAVIMLGLGVRWLRRDLAALGRIAHAHSLAVKALIADDEKEEKTRAEQIGVVEERILALEGRVKWLEGPLMGTPARRFAADGQRRPAPTCHVNDKMRLFSCA
jgi:hypothetical protein